MEYCILVVNPGSTSTKIAVFQGEKALLQKTIRHSGEELAPFGAIMDQAPFRLRCVEQALAGFDLTRLDENDLAGLADDFGISLDGLKKQQRLARLKAKAGTSA